MRKSHLKYACSALVAWGWLNMLAFILVFHRPEFSHILRFVLFIQEKYSLYAASAVCFLPFLFPLFVLAFWSYAERRRERKK